MWRTMVGRQQEEEKLELPILEGGGRWLAYCTRSLQIRF